MFNTTLGYVVTFQHNSTEYLQLSVPSGDTIEAPDNPTVTTGNSFVGWYTQINGGGTRISFPYTPSANITLYSYTVPETFITFSSENPFTFGIVDNTQYYAGTLEYSTNKTSWTTFTPSNGDISAVLNNNKEYILCLRGLNNTKITGNVAEGQGSFEIKGIYVNCTGNIENLLNYITVQNGQHPTMATYCYYRLFQGCSALTSAPSLPATTLTSYCYHSMFRGCTCLREPPALEASTLTSYCYYAMFRDCTSLKYTPTLASTSLGARCYGEMFYNCISLETITTLPATTVTDYCYYYMFYNCVKLKTTPALNATTLGIYCYAYMFYNCTSLTNMITLPATTLKNYCYQMMFRGCTSITEVPILAATTMTTSCYYGMFYGCTGITHAMKLASSSLGNNCYRQMFYGCTSLVDLIELPATTMKTYCYYQMFYGCTNIKLSTTQTGDYQTVYRIPKTGTATTASNDVAGMFTNTGGTFTGAPTLDTTYYTSNNVISAS